MIDTSGLSGLAFRGIQVVFAIEWFDELSGSDLAVVDRFRDLGVRTIGLVSDDPDELFVEGSGSATLSPFGRRIIKTMNDAGVVIDITHLKHDQMIEVIAHSNVPVVASHSNTQAVIPTRHNLPDKVIEALAEHGGSVWVSFNRTEVLGDGSS